MAHSTYAHTSAMQVLHRVTFYETDSYAIFDLSSFIYLTNESQNVRELEFDARFAIFCARNAISDLKGASRTVNPEGHRCTGT